MGRPSGSGERFDGHDYPQRLPDPGEVRAGSPAPWAGLRADARRGLGLSRVLERLGASGRSHRVSSEPRELEGVDDARRRAVTRRSAVLVALFEEDGETEVILTRRSRALRHHGGEIALPGGRCDEGESVTDAALREAREEVGLDPATATPVGWLSPLVTFASGSAIWPVVATLGARPRFVIDPNEVERVFTVALRDLAADGVFVEERWRREAARPGADEEGFIPIHFYKVPGDLVWGATARVLTELLCVVLGVDLPGGLAG
jgi:8-oxo-dGTP pyrophosphatase MutT (NUDIX family)